MKRLFNKTKNSLRQVRHSRIRTRVSGTVVCPRLSVFRSTRSMTAQLIDDVKGNTICAVTATELKGKKTVEGRRGKESVGYLLGKLLAEKALEKKIKKVVFDRSGYRYHGRVKALAEGAREGGLEF